MNWPRKAALVAVLDLWLWFGIFKLVIWLHHVVR